MDHTQENFSSFAVKQMRQQYGVNLSSESERNNSLKDISMGNGRNIDQGNMAVYIRNLCKSYDAKGPPTINNFCMNVRKGEIYGLLGSSGCGKTTILSCIVGLRKWDSGDVQVFGNKPGTKESAGKRLGYMPQDLALYNQLSTREMIQFYGRLYNMTSSEIAERWEVLKTLLDLPPNFKVIGDLSGGQRRRASLALALIHSPDLLVLDEPTVGLDPLLRSSIWDHLYKMTNTLGTTIIITTHYIEEARNSNTIGVMRKGKMLVEDTPEHLLSSHNCDLLEQVILKLCRKAEKKNSIPNETCDIDQFDNPIKFQTKWNEYGASAHSVVVPKDEYESMHGVFRNTISFDSGDMSHHRHQDSHKIANQEIENSKSIGNQFRNTEFYQALERIYGVAVVILLTYIRFPSFLILLLMIPSIQSSVTLWTVGSKPKDLSLGIVNYDVTNWTMECDMSRHYGESCDLSALSCKYINRMKEDDLFIMSSFKSEEEALSNVQGGKAWGYVVFPQNYSEHTLDRAAAGKFAFGDALEGSQIRVHLDYSQYIVYFFMAKNLLNYYLDYLKLVAVSCGFGAELLQIPLHFRSPVYGNFDENYTTFVIPGVIFSSIYGMVGLLTGLIVITERRQGTWNRARVAGLTTTDVIAANLITQGIVTVGQMIILNGVLYAVFDFRYVSVDSQWLSLGYCFLIGLASVGMGLLVGMICETEVEALVSGFFLVPIFFLFGGVILPIEYMSKVCRYMGYMLPTTLPTHAFRSIIVRGVGLAHPLVWPGFLVLVAWILLMPVYGVLAYNTFCD